MSHTFFRTCDTGPKDLTVETKYQTKVMYSQGNIFSLCQHYNLLWYCVLMPNYEWAYNCCVF